MSTKKSLRKILLLLFFVILKFHASNKKIFRWNKRNQIKCWEIGIQWWSNFSFDELARWHIFCSVRTRVSSKLFRFNKSEQGNFKLGRIQIKENIKTSSQKFDFMCWHHPLSSLPYPIKHCQSFSNPFFLIVDVPSIDKEVVMSFCVILISINIYLIPTKFWWIRLDVLSFHLHIFVYQTF